MEPYKLLFILAVLGGSGALFLAVINAEEGPKLIKQWLKNRKELKAEELKTRRIEALAKMSAEGQKKLLDEVPDWIDKSDPDEVRAWQAARGEVLK